MKSQPGSIRPTYAAAQAALAYLVFGILWILLSDRLLLALVRDPVRLTAFQNYKGWIFVAITAVALFGLLRYFLASTRASQARLAESEERFRTLTQTSPDAVLVEQDGRCVYVNPSAVRLFGAQSCRDLMGVSLIGFFAPEREKSGLPQRDREGGDEASAPIEVRLRRLDNRFIDVQATFGSIEWKGTKAVQGILRDVSRLKQTEERLRQVSDRLRSAIEGSGECIWDLDLRKNRVAITGRLPGIIADSAETIRGAPQDWRDLVHPEDAERVRMAFKAALAPNTASYECEYRMRAADGSWRWVRARGSVVEREVDGTPLVITGTLADITVRKDAEEITWRYAHLDPLTGLPNRRLFNDRLAAELKIAKRLQTNVAILFIDLDGFKRINDLFGHDAGDALLVEAARRLEACVRETDFVARLGGDEFTATLTQLGGSHQIDRVCGSILSCLSKPFPVGGDDGNISCSIGISLYPADGSSAEDLLRKADHAMYIAKRAGKNQFHYFKEEMDRQMHERLLIANALRNALDKKQLFVHYQPVVDLHSGEIVKAEALVRWHHPSLGDIAPSDFIPIAEESGLIGLIGDFVFMEAVRLAQSCSERVGSQFQVSINKSPLQFLQRRTGENWLGYLSTAGIRPGAILLEITEGVLLAATEQVSAKLNDYKAAGVQMALDDFGTGYSSLSYLQKFRNQIDYVKIDQSFVRDMSRNASSRAIAEAIILMAHKLGKEVVAEGVETQSQLDFLMEAGCDYGQGYLFSHPVPGQQLMEMLDQRRVLSPPYLH